MALIIIGLLVIAGIIAYWVVMATLFTIGIVCVLWFLVFALFVNDPYVAVLCSIVATTLTIWWYSMRSDKR